MAGMPRAHVLLTRPCNGDPLTPHFYIVNLGFTVVLIFSYFCKNKINTSTIFHLKIIILTAVKYYSILYGYVFVVYSF